MRTTRIYHPDELSINVEIILEKNSTLHVRDVLRMQVGDAIILFNGNGLDYLGTIVRIDKKAVRVVLHATEKRHTISPLKIHLAQGLCRGEKMDFAIQKATELGVTEITPIISEYCNVRLNTERLQKKQQHWQKVAASACEQCGRTDLLRINPSMDFNTWIKQKFSGIAYILDPSATKSIDKITTSIPSQVILLIGPEGGFTNNEIQYAILHQYHTILLGPRILRSETAGLVAVTLLQHLYGDI